MGQKVYEVWENSIAGKYKKIALFYDLEMAIYFVDNLCNEVGSFSVYLNDMEVY